MYVVDESQSEPNKNNRFTIIYNCYDSFSYFKIKTSKTIKWLLTIQAVDNMILIITFTFKYNTKTELITGRSFKIWIKTKNFIVCSSRLHQKMQSICNFFEIKHKLLRFQLSEPSGFSFNTLKFAWSKFCNFAWRAISSLTLGEIAIIRDIWSRHDSRKIAGRLTVECIVSLLHNLVKCNSSPKQGGILGWAREASSLPASALLNLVTLKNCDTRARTPLWVPSPKLVTARTRNARGDHLPCKISLIAAFTSKDAARPSPN